MPDGLETAPLLTNARNLFSRLRATGVSWRGFSDIAGDLSLSEDELRGALGMDEETFTTVMRSDAGAKAIPAELEPRIVALAHLYLHLQQTFRSTAAIPMWIRAESRYLGGRTAADLLRDGQIQRVDAALEALDYGAFV